MKCLYIHRGSFKSTPLPVLVSKMKDSQPLKDKSLDVSLGFEHFQAEFNLVIGSDSDSLSRELNSESSSILVTALLT